MNPVADHRKPAKRVWHAQASVSTDAGAKGEKTMLNTLHSSRLIIRLALALALLWPAAVPSPVQGAPVPAAPAQPATLDFIQVAAGYAHTCTLTAGGGAMCWGANSSGQLGDDTIIDRSTPAPVSGLESGVTALVTGGITPAL
jgi:hypothetical protein